MFELTEELSFLARFDILEFFGVGGCGSEWHPEYVGDLLELALANLFDLPAKDPNNFWAVYGATLGERFQKNLQSFAAAVQIK